MREKTVLTIGAFDLAKGVGMLCIVIGHTMSRYAVPLTGLPILLRILGIGMMPLFFVISGIGVREMKAGKLAKKLAKELLLPYAYVTLAVAVLFPLMHYGTFRWWEGAVKETIRTVLAYLTGCPQSGKTWFGVSLYECSVAWFFLALFWGSLLLNGILHRTKGAGQYLAVIGCVAAGFGCEALDFWYLCIPQGLWAVGYMYAGYRIKRSGWLEKPHAPWQLVLLGCAAAVEIGWGEVNLAYALFRWGALDYVGAGLTGIAMLWVTLWLNQWEGRVSDGLCTIGRYTYYAMCIHSVEINCIPWYLLSEGWKQNPYPGFGIEIVLRCCLLAAGCALLYKFSRYRRRKRRKPLCMKKTI